MNYRHKCKIPDEFMKDSNEYTCGNEYTCECARIWSPFGFCSSTGKVFWYRKNPKLENRNCFGQDWR